MEHNIKNKNSRIAFIFSFLILIIFIAIYFLRGENSYLGIGDNMDGALTSYKLVVDNKAHFWPSDKLLDGMIGMQPRGVYPSEFEPILWMYTFLPTMTAYSVNFALLHIIAFFGMFFLLIEIFKKTEPRGIVSSNIIILASLCSLVFSTTNFWPHAGISSAGIPLVMTGIMKIERGQELKAFFLFFIYAIYSSLILSGIFVLFSYGIFLLVTLLNKKKFAPLVPHLIGILIIATVYIVANYRLFQISFSDSFNSHRDAFTVAAEIGFIDVIKSLLRVSFNNIFSGQMHVGQLPPLVPIIAISFSIYFLVSRKYSNSIFSQTSWFFILLIMSVLVMGNIAVKQFIGTIPFVKMIQWDRFYFLLPTASVLVLMMGVSLFQKKSVFSLLLLVLTGFALWGFVMDHNWNSPIKKLFKIEPVSFKEFYREDVFKHAKSWLEGNDYSRVVALGYHPSVNTFNQIKSADGYLSTYSIESKHAMYDIIKGELDLNRSVERNFLNWGSRCYFFNSDLPINKLYHKVEGFKFNRELAYNYEAAHKAGIDYILSIYPIDVEINPRLELKKIFVDTDSYEVFAYFIK